LSWTSLLGELKSRVGAKGSTELLRLIEAPPVASAGARQQNPLGIS
jgi:hypothetical protein